MVSHDDSGLPQRQWLAAKLIENGVGYTKLDNVFLHLDDIDRAQAFADRFPSLDWPKLLEDWARQVNPLLDGLLKGQRHWVLQVNHSQYLRLPVG